MQINNLIFVIFPNISLNHKMLKLINLLVAEAKFLVAVLLQ